MKVSELIALALFVSLIAFIGWLVSQFVQLIHLERFL